MINKVLISKDKLRAVVYYIDNRPPRIITANNPIHLLYLISDLRRVA
jgi:hypothetical protein